MKNYNLGDMTRAKDTELRVLFTKLINTVIKIE